MAQLFLFRWFTKSGWIGKLFAQQPGDTVSVKVAATKTADAIDTALVYETEIDLIAESISDNVGASANEVEDKLKEVRDQLRQIETLPDIAESLQDFTFSADEDTNHYIKDMVTTTALAFNDGKISPAEAGLLVVRTIAFVKLKKGL